MRIATLRIIAAIAAVGAVATPSAQIDDPLAPPVVKGGLMVEIRDIARLPGTRGLRPPDQDVTPAGWARVSFVRDSPDGRRFVNDSRGFLYVLDRNNQPSLYADVAAAFPFAVYNRLESGFIGFDFHPEFASNGLFYTVHGERATGNPAVPDFIPPGYTRADVTHHNVITEWRATNPSASTFEGTRRELLRVATSSTISPTRSATWGSIRRRSPALRTTASSIRAAAIWGSAMAGGRTRTTRVRRSASTR